MTTQQFIDFARQGRNDLLRIAAQYLPAAADGEDTVQEVLIKLWAVRERLTDHEEMAKYATTAIRHTALNLLRDRERRQFVSLDEESHALATPPDLSAVEQAERRQYVRHVIRQLPAADRTLLRMRSIDQLSYSDIAALLGISEGAVRQRLSRARKFLITRITP